MKKPRLFLDSSVLFSATYSPTGGSAKLFTLAHLHRSTSVTVLAEVEQNVRHKLSQAYLERFFSLASLLTYTHELPDESLLSKARRVIVEKDALILAEFMRAQADYLVTLDKKHFFTAEVTTSVAPREIVKSPICYKKRLAGVLNHGVSDHDRKSCPGAYQAGETGKT